MKDKMMISRGFVKASALLPSSWKSEINQAGTSGINELQQIGENNMDPITKDRISE